MVGNNTVEAVIGATISPTFTKAFSKAKKAAKRLGETVAKIGGAASDRKYNRLIKHNRHLAESIDKAKRRQDALNRSLRTSNTLMKRGRGYAGSAAKAAGVAAVGGFGLSRIIGSGMEFESAISDVNSVANQKGSFDTLGTAQAALADQIKRLGANTAWTGTEVASAAKFLTMAGFDISKTIGALPATLDLATASKLDLGQTADIMSNIMTPFKLGADQTERVADTLTAVFTTSNTDLAKLGETMKYVAPIAAKLGMSMSDTAAMAGILGNSGIQASQAGTTLRAMFNRLAAPGTKAQSILAGLNVETQDANGNLRDLTGILADVSNSMSNKGLGTAEQLAVLKEVFGEEAMAGVSTLIDAAEQNGEDTSEALQKYMKKIRDTNLGLTKKVAKIQLDNTKGDILLAGSAIAGLWTTIYDAVNPVIRTVVQGFTDIVTKVNEWMMIHPKLTKVIGLAAGGMVIFAGAMATAFTIMAIGSFATGLLTKNLGFLNKGFSAVTWAVRGLGLALTLNPLGLVIAAADFRSLFFYQYLQVILDQLHNLIEIDTSKLVFSAAQSREQ